GCIGRRLRPGRRVPPFRGTGRAPGRAGDALAVGGEPGAARVAEPLEVAVRAPRAGDRLERAGPDRLERRLDAGADLRRIAHRLRDDLVLREVAVAEGHILGGLAPDLDARSPVALQLHRRGRAGPGLPVHGLPR